MAIKIMETMKVLAGTIIIGVCLSVGTEAFQCPRIASCDEENVTKSGVNGSSVSREQLISSLTVSLVSSQKMIQYEGTYGVCIFSCFDNNKCYLSFT